MWEKCCDRTVCEAKEYTASDLKRAVSKNVEPLQKRVDELQAQNFKLKLALRTVADAMTP